MTMKKADIDGNGWNEYEKLVLHQLRELQEKADKNLEEHAAIKEDIATLKVKSGVWGLIGGMIPVGIALLIWILKTI